MNKTQAHITGSVISSNSAEAQFLHKKSRFGEKVGDKIQYTLSEAMFLLEKEKIEIFSGKKKLTEKELMNKLQKIDKRFQTRYPVFKNLREKGYKIGRAHV